VAADQAVRADHSGLAARRVLVGGVGAFAAAATVRTEVQASAYCHAARMGRSGVSVC